MKKWAPIIFAGVVVLLLRLPTYIMKKNVEEKLQDKSFQENLNRKLAEKGDYWAKKQIESYKKPYLSEFKKIGLPKKLEIVSPNDSLPFDPEARLREKESEFDPDVYLGIEKPIKLNENSPYQSSLSSSKSNIKSNNIQFSVDKNKINIDDTLTFSVIATDEESFPDVNISLLQNDFVIVSGPVQQTNIERFKGNVVTTRTLSWKILPRNVGDVVIPALSGEVDGKSFSGKPIKIHVDKSNSSLKNKYVDSESGLSIDFPSGWLIKESNIRNVMIKAVEETKDGKLSIISIMKIDLGYNDDMWTMSALELFDQLIAETPDIECELLDWGKSIIAGNHCVWLRIQYKAGPFPTTLSTFYYFIHNKDLFRINCSTYKIPGWYENIEEKFRQSIASITFPNKSSQSVKNKYVDNQLGFSIVFPINWKIKDGVSLEEIAIKADHHADNGDYAALIIYVFEEDGSVDFSNISGKDFFELSFNESGAELLDYGEKTINGERAVWIKMKMNIGFQAYTISYIISHSSYIYQLFGQTVGNYDWFKLNEAKIISSIETFKLRK